ncbi:cytochrome C oxidase subunit IV family protein [Hymenobacter koreensis]|uniref:Cytochrome C oxidase subunit IV n=1 Tax=Hymenobacter koreensis TaxID=1084523 RepID=A0ABP8IW78_9BACT
MAHHAPETDYNAHGEAVHGKPNVKPILKALLWIVGITAFEFVLAFAMDAGTLRNSIFIILTIFKAFFIVAEFMHLRHETKGLIWTIMVPMALLIWLLVALISEGSFVGESVFNAYK